MPPRFRWLLLKGCSEAKGGNETIAQKLSAIYIAGESGHCDAGVRLDDPRGDWLQIRRICALICSAIEMSSRD